MGLRRISAPGILGLIAATAICQTDSPPRPVKLNPDAVSFASRLIANGHVVADKMGEWRAHKPSPEAENAFIAKFGYAEYAKWHLGLDETHPADTKAHYKFPFGDFTNLHRCGVIAAQQRARQFGYGDIAQAAAQLQRAIDDRPPNPPTPTETHR